LKIKILDFYSQIMSAVKALHARKLSLEEMDLWHPWCKTF